VNIVKKVAIIPLRAGSKGIKHKNRKKMLGRPLFSWVLLEAYKSVLDEIYVFTDDDNVIQYVSDEYAYLGKIKIMKRSKESATDEASTEYAMKEFIGRINNNYDIICLLQATSPLTTKDDINKVVEKVEKDKYDASLTVVRNKRFIWNENGTAVNYDYIKRPRRQEFGGFLVENGAVYATTRKQFEESGTRIGGKISLVEMPSDTLIEIDESSDWIIVEELMKNRLRRNKARESRIKAVFLDVDGVLTNGGTYFTEDGELLKKFSMRDGMGLEILKENDIHVFVVTSEKSKIVKSRMEKLGITDFFLGVKDKYALVEYTLREIGLSRSECAYIGDDINDLANMLSIGWSFCPNNAMREVIANSDFVLHNNGGNEAVREAIDFILSYNRRRGSV